MWTVEKSEVEGRIRVTMVSAGAAGLLGKAPLTMSTTIGLPTKIIYGQGGRRADL